MTRNDEVVCQEALSLLRQEVALSPGFSQDDYLLPRTKCEIACRRTFDYARRAFLAAHDWNFARASAAFGAERTGCVRVLDVVDAEGATVAWHVDGNDVCAGEGAETVVYTRDAEDATAWPPLARAAFVAYLAKEMCIPVSGRQEDLKALDAMAQERTAAAWLANVREGEPSDGPAAEALALLRGGAAVAGATVDDGAFAALRRFPTFLKSAVDEVWAMHDWGGLGSLYEGLPKLAQSAAVALAAHKMAVRCGADAARAKSLLDLYQARLVAARVHALEHEQPADPVAMEVAAVLRPMQSLPPSALPRSVASRVSELLAMCRDEVLSSHRWNFARAKLPARAVPGPGGECLVARPADCARVERVVGAFGEKVEWFMRGPWIVAHAPVEAVVYIRREEDAAEWPPSVRRALVYRIAAEVAMQGGDERLMAMYRRQLSDAALQDAREGNPGRSAWGRGRFAEAMGGGRIGRTQFGHQC